MARLPISAIILTYNEELNIEDCLRSIAAWIDEIIVVDSGSTDATLEVARRYAARIHERRFENQAEQFNWALDHLAIRNDWVLRLDADEIMLRETWEEIEARFGRLTNETSGFYAKRRVYFLGRWIRHGGYYPAWFLRLWRRDAGRYENRAMDEHVVLSTGGAIHLENDFEEHDRKGLTHWIEKHNRYATREARAYVEERIASRERGLEENRRGTDPERRRWYKNHYYYKLPPFLRAMLYWNYRYFLRLGFLDGTAGLIFHFLQGFWYRFLVDCKIYEMTRRGRAE